MRVLFVEDSKHLRNYVAKALKRAGYATDVASDGEEGLFLATTNDYDAIVLDLMLPKIDGLEVLQRLRREGCKTHLIILTART
ncbi:MAG: response regulator, partial [Verrucomicrobiales bacterium]